MFRVSRTTGRLIGFICLLWLICARQTPANQPVILVLGDSLSAGYGIEIEQAWPSLLGLKLLQLGYQYEVVNASISGETTRGGLSRIDELLDRHRPAILLIELGANDGLRGLPVTHVEANLEQLIDKAASLGIDILLFEMRVPRNYGPKYEIQFAQMYERLARKKRVSLVPFFLNDVVLNKELMQRDGLHPTRDAQPIMLAYVWQFIEVHLESSLEEFGDSHEVL